MHILYIHQHFALPRGSTGTRSYEFARRWVQAGHRVTMIAGKFDIGGLDLSRRRQVIDGIHVRIAGARYGNTLGFARRIASFLLFTPAAILSGMWVRDVDVIFATSTPLTIGLPAMALKRIKRRPFVFEVRDQWPEVPIEMGYIRNPALKKALLWLERTIYRSSAGVVALSPGMAAGVRSVMGRRHARPVVVAPNCSDTMLFRPNLDAAAVRARQGWEGKFVLLHFGAMGRANGLDFLIDAAERLKHEDAVRIVLIGGGSERARLRRLAASKGLANIEILDPRPKEELPGLVAACDVSTVIFAPHPILEHNSANKFFDSLSAGKPVLLNYSGWQREVLEEAEAGLGCARGNLDAYTANVKRLLAHPELRASMAANARKLAESRFSRDLLAGQVLGLLETVHYAVKS